MPLKAQLLLAAFCQDCTPTGLALRPGATQIGVWLGLRRPAVLAAPGKLPPEAVEDWWDGDRRVYSWGTVARLVAGWMRMEE